MVFRKDGINHIARIVTHVDVKKGKEPKLVSLLTNEIVRITLMYYINMEKLLNNPYKDLEKMLAESMESPPENVENLQGGLIHAQDNVKYYL